MKLGRFSMIKRKTPGETLLPNSTFPQAPPQCGTSSKPSMEEAKQNLREQTSLGVVKSSLRAEEKRSPSSVTTQLLVVTSPKWQHRKFEKNMKSQVRKKCPCLDVTCALQYERTKACRLLSQIWVHTRNRHHKNYKLAHLPPIGLELLDIFDQSFCQ